MFKALASAMGFGGKPAVPLAVILICYKMEDQIGNTIRSLLPPCQKGIDIASYEILVVDNGSPSPLPEARHWSASSNAPAKESKS